MSSTTDRYAYWNSAGSTKTFTHPLALDWFEHLPRQARILDYGCGYGRILSELDDHGFTDLTGVDYSPALIKRGREQSPGLSLSVLENPPHMPYQDGGFDAVLLMAVLACIPGDTEQAALIAELRRVLKPGGLLFLSDVTIQDDSRNRARYRAHRGPTFGVFDTDDGGVFRHHDPGYLRGLFAEFTITAERRLDMPTLNGHVVEGIQLLLRRD